MVLGPHLAADSGRWVKPQARRGLGQEEEVDLRGFLREGVCSGPENSFEFPNRGQRGQGRGWGFYNMATGWGFSQPALKLCEPESLRVGRKGLEDGGDVWL